MCFVFSPDDNLNQDSPVQPSISQSVIQPHTRAFTGIPTQPLHTLLRLMPGSSALILLCDLFFLEILVGVLSAMNVEGRFLTYGILQQVSQGAIETFWLQLKKKIQMTHNWV